MNGFGPKMNEKEYTEILKLTKCTGEEPEEYVAYKPYL